MVLVEGDDWRKESERHLLSCAAKVHRHGGARRAATTALLQHLASALFYTDSQFLVL